MRVELGYKGICLCVELPRATCAALPTCTPIQSRWAVIGYPKTICFIGDGGKLDSGVVMLAR